MVHGSFDLRTLGTYFCHSAINQLNINLNQHKERVSKYTTPVASGHNGYFGWTPKSHKSINLDEIFPLLILEHERHHYQQLMSTPCGLLYWRILNSITSTIGFILNKVGNSTAKNTCYLPLIEWYTSIGKEAILKDPPSPPEVISKKLGSNSDRLRSIYPSYIDLKFNEVSILMEFLSAFQGRLEMNMQDFVTLANESSKILARDTDIDLNIRWTAHDLNASSYLPEHGFTMIEIIEASARIHEQRILEAYKISNEEFEEWKKRSIFGVYKPIYDLILDELGGTIPAQIAIDNSMITPLDICCSEAVSGLLYVEDALPSWRLTKVIPAINDIFWPTDRQKQEYEAREGIALRANIPTPDHVIKATLTKRFSGPMGWSGDIKLYGIPEEITHIAYFSYTEAEIKRGLQIRNRDSLAFINPLKPDVFQPLLEFFEDKAFFHGSPVTDHSDDIHLKGFTTLVFNLAMLAFLNNGDVSHLQKLQHSFSNRMKEYGDISKIKHLWDVKSILNDNLDPVLLNLLKW